MAGLFAACGKGCPEDGYNWRAGWSALSRGCCSGTGWVDVGWLVVEVGWYSGRLVDAGRQVVGWLVGCFFGVTGPERLQGL